MQRKYLLCNTLLEEKKSIKNFVTGKIIRHFLPTNFFAWN